MRILREKSNLKGDFCMDSANFAKGIGVGLVVGSAIGMVVSAPTKSTKKKSVVGRALKTTGDIVENIGDAISM